MPNQVKIGLSAMIALLVSGFADVSQVEYTGLIGYAVIVLKEGITGLLIGLAANVCNSIILFAGNIIDMDIGLSMATEFDPINNAQVTLTGNLYNYFILMLLVVTDMHHYILRAFVDAFTVIPVNGQVFDWGASDEIHDNLYGRHVCDSISYHFAGICMYHDLKTVSLVSWRRFHRR